MTNSQPAILGATAGTPIVVAVASEAFAGPAVALGLPDLHVGLVAGFALVRSRSEGI
jgi:hypothetical protein